VRFDFVIEQMAVAPSNPAAAKELLEALGLADRWVEDHVVAEGQVYQQPRGGGKPFPVQATNEADLAYAYQRGMPLELEVLHYTKGVNWLTGKAGGGSRRNTVCHLGMHCTKEELAEWKAFFAKRNISIAQEVGTISHTNPVIAGKRTYHYCVFNTKALLGVDLKFIVRKGAIDG
jgi:hypothetical protein